jgi:hypothetical protein
MKMRGLGLAAAALAVAALACSDPTAVAAAQKYEAEACACASPECAEGVDSTFQATAHPSRVIRAADQAEYIRAAQHGYECYQKARKPPPCGGPQKLTCPRELPCLMPASASPDQLGECRPHPTSVPDDL